MRLRPAHLRTGLLLRARSPTTKPMRPPRISGTRLRSKSAVNTPTTPNGSRPLSRIVERFHDWLSWAFLPGRVFTRTGGHTQLADWGRVQSHQVPEPLDPWGFLLPPNLSPSNKAYP